MFAHIFLVFIILLILQCIVHIQFFRFTYVNGLFGYISLPHPIIMNKYSNAFNLNFFPPYHVIHKGAPFFFILYYEKKTNKKRTNVQHFCTMSLKLLKKTLMHLNKCDNTDKEEQTTLASSAKKTQTSANDIVHYVPKHGRSKIKRNMAIAAQKGHLKALNKRQSKSKTLSSDWVSQPITMATICKCQSMCQISFVSLYCIYNICIIGQWKTQEKRREHVLLKRNIAILKKNEKGSVEVSLRKKVCQERLDLGNILSFVAHFNGDINPVYRRWKP